MASTFALSRPSEKLGTHSTSVDIREGYLSLAQAATSVPSASSVGVIRSNQRGAQRQETRICQPSPHTASTYRPIVIGRSARMPTTSDKVSKSPPQTAPSILAASAELGESVIRNSSANKSPAKKTGIAKVKATIEPTYLVEPEMLLKGMKYTMSKLARSPITVQDRRHNSGLSSITTFANSRVASNAPIAIAFTSQVVPKYKASRLMA